MRTVTRTLLALCLVALWSIPVQAQKTGEVVYTATPPVIDGQWEDVWEASNAFPLVEVRGSVIDEVDLSGNGYALWDENFLYVMFVVQDGDLIADADEGGHARWQDDSAEFYLDPDNSKCFDCYDAGDAQYRFWINPIDETDLEVNNSIPTEGTTYAVAYFDEPFDVDGKAYQIEAAIAWSNHDATPANGKQLGMDFHLNDDDTGGAARDGKLHWNDAEGDNQWQHADNFGTVTLVGGPGAAIANAAFTRSPSGRAVIGEMIAFDASTSTAPGNITSYEWDFGDGNTATGSTVEHAYDAEGVFTVTLTVTDDGGATGTATKTVTIWSGLGTDARPLQIPMAPGVPAIDGEREALWDDAQMVTLESRANNNTPESPEDLTVQAYLMWDNDNLYLFYDVRDADLFNDSGNGWQDDTPEIYLDGGNEKATTYDDNDVQWEMSWNNNGIVSGNTAGRVEGLEFVTLDVEGGYTLEAMMPWANVPLDPAAGTKIGLELMVNDDDTGGDNRDTKIAWYTAPGVDEAWQNPSLFGTALLVEELTTDVAPSAELPDGFAISSIYPNPFNPTTTAVLDVRNPGAYTVRVYDVLGRLVREHALVATAPGQMQVALELGNEASGLYLVSVQHDASGATATARAMLLK